MRELTAYAASRSLSAAEAAQVQEWVDILQAEIQTLDKSTADGTPVLPDFSVSPRQGEKPVQ